MADPSESLECLDRVDSVLPVVLDGVDTDRSRSGTASNASEGVTDGEGESGRCMGLVMLDSGGEGAASTTSDNVDAGSAMA